MTFKAQMFFTDDIPQFYCGRRGVVIKVGRKWVRIYEPATRKSARISVKRWERVKHRVTVSA